MSGQGVSVTLRKKIKQMCAGIIVDIYKRFVCAKLSRDLEISMIRRDIFLSRGYIYIF